MPWCVDGCSYSDFLYSLDFSSRTTIGSITFGQWQSVIQPRFYSTHPTATHIQQVEVFIHESKCGFCCMSAHTIITWMMLQQHLKSLSSTLTSRRLQVCFYTLGKLVLLLPFASLFHLDISLLENQRVRAHRDHSVIITHSLHNSAKHVSILNLFMTCRTNDDLPSALAVFNDN